MLNPSSRSAGSSLILNIMAQVRFNATVKRYANAGEKTGWYHIEVPAEIAEKLVPGTKKSFRVKGFLDKHAIRGVALIPMGGGDYIMALNQALRKATGAGKGSVLRVVLEPDTSFIIKVNPELLECLKDEPIALTFFNSLPKSHRDYFTKWIESAKTEETRTRRIAHTVTALSKQAGYGEMLRGLKKEKF